MSILSTHAPGAHHLEEGVVVYVLSHVIEVVVLPARADTLLAVHCPPEACQRARWVGLPQKYGLELAPAVSEANGRARRGEGRCPQAVLVLETQKARKNSVRGSTSCRGEWFHGTSFTLVCHRARIIPNGTAKLLQKQAAAR